MNSLYGKLGSLIRAFLLSFFFFNASNLYLSSDLSLSIITKYGFGSYGSNIICLGFGDSYIGDINLYLINFGFHSIYGICWVVCLSKTGVYWNYDAYLQVRYRENTHCLANYMRGCTILTVTNNNPMQSYINE